MGLEDEFMKASEDVKTLSQRPSNDSLLQLYSLFKQAKDGDVSGKRPGMLDIKGRAKFDAWSKLKGLSKEDAMKQYIDTVQGLMN